MTPILQADHREARSGIPGLLCNNARVCVTLSALRAGDYIINHCVGVERKSADDFVQSLISNRLFEQISRLRRSFSRPLLIIEGNPYQTGHQINELSVRNAILCIMLAWQVPVLFSKNKNHTANVLEIIALQEQKPILPVKAPQVYRPRNILGKKLFLLQAIPGVGPMLAIRLLQQFKSIKAVLNASEKRLEKRKGLAAKKLG